MAAKRHVVKSSPFIGSKATHVLAVDTLGIQSPRREHLESSDIATATLDLWVRYMTWPSHFQVGECISYHIIVGVEHAVTSQVSDISVIARSRDVAS